MVTQEHVFHCDTCRQEWFFKETAKPERRDDDGNWLSTSPGGWDDYYEHADYRLKFLYLCGLIPNRMNLERLTNFVMTPPRPHHEKK